MTNEKPSNAAQLRDHTDPAASPLGTDDEAAGTTDSADRIEMAREAESKIDEAKRRTGDVDAAHSKRASSSPYGKEEHMNEELAKQKEAEQQPS